MKNVLDTESIILKIKEFSSFGYDQIKIPGGTSKNEEHYSGTFLYFFDKEKKQMFFLGVPYNSLFYKTNEGNGHTKKIGETSTETARREVYEETGLLVDEVDLELVFSFSIPNRKDKTKEHRKFFYLANKYHGTLSDFVGQPNPIDGETSTPIWIPAKLFKQVLYKGHQEAFIKVIENLSGISADYYYALLNL